MAILSATVLDGIGNTPMVRLRRMVPPDAATVLAKLESANPGGSVKDRTARAMVEEAASFGLLGPETVLVEPTSGNMGVALALVCAVKGYKLLVPMPESTPLERRRILSHYGAELRLTDASRGMEAAIEAAKEMVSSKPGHVMLDQFRSPACVRVHRETTAREVLAQTGGTIHAFVAGVGTGATISGVGQALKERDPGTLVVALEPASSPVLSGGQPEAHGIPGIGADFVPPLLDWKVIDEVQAISDEEAASTMRQLALQEGLMVGVSSGANVAAALRVARRLGPGKVVVTILPDTGERYLGLPV